MGEWNKISKNNFLNIYMNRFENRLQKKAVVYRGEIWEKIESKEERMRARNTA